MQLRFEGVVHFLRSAICIGLLTAASLSAQAQTEPEPVIAAASDLQFALVEVADKFKVETGKSVKLAFGSSGNFARQIRQNAPYQMFFSADAVYVDDLARDGFVRDKGELYGVGRLVIITPNKSSLKADSSLVDLKAALRDGRVTKFAIANPAHAPYGARSVDVLRHVGLWSEIEKKLVLGENVSQAAQFALSGSTQGGMIAYALALSSKVSSNSTFALIPAEWHTPLLQTVALTVNAGPVAREFYTYIQRPVARTVFRKFGFTIPGEPQ